MLYLEVCEEHQDVPCHDAFVRMLEVVPSNMASQVWQACIPSKNLL